MNKTDLYGIGDIYGKILDGVELVEEKSDKELNDKGAAELKDGGPKKEGGYKDSKLDPGKDGKDDEYDSKKFTYASDDDECDEEDEEILIEAVQSIASVFAESTARNDDAIEMIVEMGRISLPNLRTVIHNLNKTNKQATINLLTTVNENATIELYQECGNILDAVIRYDKKQKQTAPINEGGKRRSKAINTNSMKKSSFDKLFEAVMDGGYDDELDELGIDGDTNDEFGELGDDLEGDLEGGDDITCTIPRDVAQTLCDLLQGCLGEGEGDLEDVDDLEGDDFAEDEFGGAEEYEEDEELPGTAGGSAKGEGIPAAAGVPKQHSKAVDYGKQNKVSKLKPVGGKAADGSGIPAEAGVPKQRSQAVDFGKNNKRSKLKTGTGAFEQ